MAGGEFLMMKCRASHANLILDMRAFSILETLGELKEETRSLVEAEGGEALLLEGDVGRQSFGRDAVYDAAARPRGRAQ